MDAFEALVKAARRLVAESPYEHVATDGEESSYCVVCRDDPHKDDCPWLALATAVVAFE